MSGEQAVTALAISGAFVFGLVLALLGSLKLALARRVDLGERRVGVLLLTLNVALIPMMLLAGVLLDAWGARAVLILGSVLLALALLGHGGRRASGRVAGFWAAVPASRLLVGLAQDAGHLRGPDAWGPWLLVVPALLAAVVLGNLAGATSPRSARVGLLLLGLFL